LCEPLIVAGALAGLYKVRFYTATGIKEVKRPDQFAPVGIKFAPMAIWFGLLGWFVINGW